MRELEGKKLLILGGNPETKPLVEVANRMGIRTIVTSARSTDPAKKAAWKSYDIDGMDVPKLIEMAEKEMIDGVLVGVADILVPAYCELCAALNFPCYATHEIVETLSFKDKFKQICEKHGIKGIPEYKVSAECTEEDLAHMVFPVMVKPVDNGGGVGMTVCYGPGEMKSAVAKALEASKKRRFLVERYMKCEDIGIYYTFQDGQCSASCIFDRHTSNSQRGMSKVNLCSTYPSRHAQEYFRKFHGRFLEIFREIGIQNGVLLIAGFYEDGELYVYDPGFRLQGEAPHLLMKEIHGFDQRKMLIRFALTGSQGGVDLLKEDDAFFRGKHAATLWFLVKAGKIGKITGLNQIISKDYIKYNVQRLYEGDEIPVESVGTERQVLTRLYLVCDSKEKLAKSLKECIETVRVTAKDGENMLISFAEVEDYIEKVLNGNND